MPLETYFLNCKTKHSLVTYFLRCSVLRRSLRIQNNCHVVISDPCTERQNSPESHFLLHFAANNGPERIRFSERLKAWPRFMSSIIGSFTGHWSIAARTAARERHPFKWINITYIINYIFTYIYISCECCIKPTGSISHGVT